MFRSLTSVYRRIPNQVANQVHISCRPPRNPPPPIRFYSQSQPLCPSCSKPLPTPLPACPNCAYIAALPPHSSYHDVFGLPEEPNPFSIDTIELKRRFRQAQAICHPDAWTTQGPRKLDLAQTLSSHINQGYQTLLSPLSRVEHILHRNGLEISESDKLDRSDLIMEIMSIREAIEEANIDQVLNIQEKNRAAIRDTISRIEDLVGRKEWGDVKRSAIKLRYLQGIENAAKDKLG